MLKQAEIKCRKCAALFADVDVYAREIVKILGTY